MPAIALPESDSITPQLLPPPSPPLSERRRAANRLNALKSTGPRTPAGKRRSSRNALTHGLSQPFPAHSLCHPHAADPFSDPDYATFLAELESELQPRTILQRHLLPLIADLLWRLRRLPHAHQILLSRLQSSEPDAPDQGDTTDPNHPASPLLPPCQALADAFQDPSNPLLLLNRYERSMHNALLRTLRQYHALQKSHPHTPTSPDEPPCYPEPALRADHPCHTHSNPVHTPGGRPRHWDADAPPLAPIAPLPNEPTTPTPPHPAPVVPVPNEPNPPAPAMAPAPPPSAKTNGPTISKDDRAYSPVARRDAPLNSSVPRDPASSAGTSGPPASACIPPAPARSSVPPAPGSSP